MTVYMVIDSSGVIVNRALVENLAEWPVPDGCSAIEEIEPMEIGGTYIDGVYTPLPKPPEPPVDLAAYASDCRWKKEVGGITVAGIPIATDDRSKLMITGARVAAVADPGWTTTWIGADGNAYPLDVAAIVVISDAVAAHVNACFATYATAKAGIDAGTITTTAEIDAAFA